MLPPSSGQTIMGHHRVFGDEGSDGGIVVSGTQIVEACGGERFARKLVWIPRAERINWVQRSTPWIVSVVAPRVTRGIGDRCCAPDSVSLVESSKPGAAEEISDPP